MGLPIAIGCKQSVSSRPIAAAPQQQQQQQEPLDRYYCSDGTLLVKPRTTHGDEDAHDAPATIADDPHPSPPAAPIVFTAESPDHELQAILTLSYHVMVRSQPSSSHGGASTTPSSSRSNEAAVLRRRCSCSTPAVIVAEIRILVCPLAEPFSSMSSREDMYRFELMPEEEDEVAETKTATTTSTTAAATTSSPEKTPQHDNTHPRQHQHKHQEQQQGHRPSDDDDDDDDDGVPLRPSAAFSANHWYVTCLIPHPDGRRGRSRLVNFQLRRPRRASSSSAGGVPQRTAPPLPSYIQQQQQHQQLSPATAAATTNTQPSSASATAGVTGNHPSHPATALVATNPRVLKIHNHGRNDEHRSSSSTTSSSPSSSSFPPQHHICSICDVAITEQQPYRGGPSLLLASTLDGTIVVISYRTFCVEGVLYTPTTPSPTPPRPGHNIEENNEGRLASKNTSRIKYIEHFTEWYSRQLGEAQGRLVTLHEDGRVTVFRSHLRVVPSTASSSPSSSFPAANTINASYNNSVLEKERDKHHYYGGTNGSVHHQITPKSVRVSVQSKHDGIEAVEMALTPFWEWQGPFITAKFVSASCLALLELPAPTATVKVWAMCENGEAGPVSVMEMNQDQLRENAHTYFTIENNSTPQAVDGEDDATTRRLDRAAMIDLSGSIGLVYDELTDCLAVSSVLVSRRRSRDNHDDDNANERTLISLNRKPVLFACIWSWRTNVLGLTVLPSSPISRGSIGHGSALISKLVFAKDRRGGGRKFSHTVASLVPSFGPHRIRKELFASAVLSPRSDLCVNRSAVARDSPLLMSCNSVSYPFVSKSSIREEHEMEWMESMVPPTYVQSRGSPVLAAAGHRYCRSIAVAASSGICTMELIRDNKSFINGTTGKKSRVHTLGNLTTRTIPRWRLFGNDAEEGSFHVVAMVWWEGPMEIDNKDDAQTDLLVTVIDVTDGVDQGRYLSCWSQKMLDANHQLLAAQPNSMFEGPDTRWGVRLPCIDSTVSLDLLSQPEETSRSSTPTRKAAVLISWTSPVTEYRVYQFEIIRRDARRSAQSYADNMPFTVLSCCSCSGEIGSRSDLFLASANFGFDLETASKNAESSEMFEEYHYVATLGVVRAAGGGIDALAVSKSCVIAVGQILQPGTSSDGNGISELSSFWMADIVSGRKLSRDDMELDCFVWMLQLANGSLLSWTVPFVHHFSGDSYMSEPLHEIETESDINSRPARSSSLVHPKGVSLGMIRSCGKASSWMQQSSMGTRTDYPFCCVPGSSFGCILATGQSCRRLHRSLCENIEGGLFREDFLEHDLLCPGDFSLSPPAFVCSIYALVADTVEAGTAIANGGSQVGYRVARLLNNNPYRDSALMAIQLLVIRMVERFAAVSVREDSLDRGRSSAAYKMLTIIVEAARSVLTPAQFACLFLEVGRQIEPSMIDFLFPLPALITGTGAPLSETVEDLFAVSLDQGSIRLSVTALPLLTVEATTQLSCIAIFSHCLDTLDANGFDTSSEEAGVIGDIFRFALVLDGLQTEDESKDESVPVTDIAGSSAGFNETSLAGNSSAEDDMIDDDPSIKGYSMFCGLSRWFGGGRLSKEEQAVVDAASSFIVHGFEEEEELLDYRLVAETTHQNGEHVANVNVSLDERLEPDTERTAVAITTRYLLSDVFGEEVNGHCWKKMAAIATLLAGQTGSRCLAAADFAYLMERSNISDNESLLPLAVQQNGGLVKFFTSNILDCQEAVEAHGAGHIFDLISILLAAQDASRLDESETNGLLLIAVVVGHVADRIADILLADESICELPLMIAYVQARVEISEPWRSWGI